jgi:hypothetical protein
MKAFRSKLFIFLPCLAVINACNVINPAEDIPAYILVDSIGVYTDETTQGSSSSKLSDVWVTVDGQFLCGYPLGSKVPVLFNGNHTVTLRGGILLNGIDATRVPYAVFQSFDSTMNLLPGEVYHIVPRVSYFSSTSFPLIENFDNNTLHFTTSSNSALLIVENNSFEGNGGLVILDATTPNFECTTLDSFDLPGGTAPTYIEINYKTDTEFLVGVKANTSLGPLDYPLLNVRSSTQWNKIYVNLTAIASQAQHAEDWRIYIKAYREAGTLVNTLRFDNIKLVY